MLANRPCRVIVEHDPTVADQNGNGNGNRNGNGAVPVSAVPPQKALDPR